MVYKEFTPQQVVLQYYFRIKLLASEDIGTTERARRAGTDKDVLKKASSGEFVGNWVPQG